MLRTLTSTPQHLLRAPPQLGVGPPAQYFTEQKQDHFDPASSRTWSQAFFVNDTFWRPGSDAPIFLCVGGEGPALDGSVVVSSPHCNNAVEWLPETKAPFPALHTLLLPHPHPPHPPSPPPPPPALPSQALLFAVEHRYYGCHNASACPYSAHDAHPLQWLSSRQALGSG